jgi:(1->4)-alpha-D-glucan 1-alpha-D-glucosylmutase
MNALSTHDTKRSEDVRSRLLLLSEDPSSWAGLARTLVARGLDEGLDDHAAYLAAQTLFGAWPIEGDRLAGYLTKATKEAKLATSWTRPNDLYDRTVVDAAHALVRDLAVQEALDEWCDDPVRRTADVAASLSAKLLQLTMPGIPDCYQGCETENRSLADPDNRRDIAFDALRATLTSGSDVKQRLTATVLRLRRARPEWFGIDGAYAPLALDDERFVGFTRAGHVAVVATRRPWATSRDAVPVPSPGPGWTALLDDAPGVGLWVRPDDS